MWCEETTDADSFIYVPYGQRGTWVKGDKKHDFILLSDVMKLRVNYGEKKIV